MEPKFYSDASSFQVTLYNLNYGTDEIGAVGEEKVALEQEKVAFEAKKVAFEHSISELKLNKPKSKETETNSRRYKREPIGNELDDFY